MKRVMICGAILGSAVAAQANLILNGGFEMPGPTGGTYEAVGGTGNTSIANWSTVYNGVEWFNPATYSNWGNACEGNYVIDLNYVTTAAGGLEQSFATNPNQEYLVEFCAGTVLDAGRNGSGLVCATMGDVEFDFVVTNNTNQIQWQQYSFVAEAGFNISTLRFFTVLDSNTHFAFVDDVRVTAVPEPATMTAVLVGCAALARRRKSKKS